MLVVVDFDLMAVVEGDSNEDNHTEGESQSALGGHGKDQGMDKDKVDEVGGVGLWDLFESWIVVGWNWCVKVVVGDESGCW